MKRCKWVNLNNPLYVSYHDNEWSKPIHNDKKLLEVLILETFQAGLSWECVLNKREDFKAAYDDFEIDKIVNYNEEKINQLLNNEKIIRNRLKIKASIKNSIVFRKIQNEYKSFDKYIWSFTKNKTINESWEKRTTSSLSDEISKDLRKRGMSFVGSTIIYAYLQAIGIINAHSDYCDFK